MSAWKGNNANYFTVHRWMRDTFGSPQRCDVADGTCSKKFEWAAKVGNNGKSRDREDWLRLCTSHHRRYDSKDRKLETDDVREIRYYYEVGEFSQGQLADIYGVSQMNIYNIIHRKKWSHVK